VPGLGKQFFVFVPTDLLLSFLDDIAHTVLRSLYEV
jgi:hypothetical protein